jgi:hypothetical protein
VIPKIALNPRCRREVKQHYASLFVAVARLPDSGERGVCYLQKLTGIGGGDRERYCLRAEILSVFRFEPVGVYENHQVSGRKPLMTTLSRYLMNCGSANAWS